MLADGRAICFEQLSTNIQQTEFFQHLFLISSLAILFGSCCRLMVIKCQHSSKPDALYKMQLQHFPKLTYMMKAKSYCFFGIIFLLLSSCKTQHELSSENRFRGMWQLDKFEILDTLTNKWKIDTTRLGYNGFILYDGLGHMGVQQTPPGYKDYNVNRNIDSLNDYELKKLVRLYRSNYVYFSNYDLDKNIIKHKRLSATNPNDWGTVLERDYIFIGDTLILTTHENINGSKLRIRWTRLNP